MNENSQNLKVTVLQTDIAWCNPDANRERIRQLLDEAPVSDVYLLPEMFATGFCMEPAREGVAEATPGLSDWMRQWAEAHDCALAGSLPVAEGGRYYNRFHFVTPAAAVTYDKRHLFGYGGEDKVYAPGRERVVAEFRGVRFLLQVCYDLRFPVFARNRGDYDAILYVANWPTSRIEAWDALLRARAIENQCYVLAANRVGADPVTTYTGHSQVIDAFGRVVARCEDGCEGFVTAELDCARLASFRRKFPVLSDGDTFHSDW